MPALTAPAEGEPERLTELAERYFWLFEDSPVAKYVCDVAGNVLEVNSAMCRLLGALPEDIVGLTLASFSLDPPVPEAALDAFLDGRARTYSSMRRYRGAGGRSLRALVTLGAIRDADGKARTIFGSVEDLTAHDLATGELDGQRRRLELAIEASGTSVWELDVHSGRMTVQERRPGPAEFQEHTMTYGDFVRGFFPDDRGLLPTIRAFRSRACLEIDLELRSGRPPLPVRWVHLKGRATLAHDGSVVRVAGTKADVTEPRSQRAELAVRCDRPERNPLFDPLTGLPNLDLLVDRLSGALHRLSRAPGSVAVLFIGVDRFEHINDSISHQAGDEFLVQLGQRLRGALRPSDTVARVGADELVVLCEALEGERAAMAVAARVEGLFSTPFLLGGPASREIYASATVGIALASDAATNAEALLRDAGMAMNRAKVHGGGHTEVFDAEIRRRSIADFETEPELRRALGRGDLSDIRRPSGG